ncbi:Threonine aspartase 1 [Nymphon striatum]|nr:Threonine aspartase 1 [Nymphon striatum]
MESFKNKRHFVIAVHAGAGFHSSSKEPLYKEVCTEACNKAKLHLDKGCSLVDAVTIAIEHLENSALTNAGYGSNLNVDGAIECDASIMDGETSFFGAVGAVKGVKNPISVAKSILMEQNNYEQILGRVPPCFLAGEGAQKWAKEKNLLQVPIESLRSESAVRRYLINKRKYDECLGENSKKKVKTSNVEISEEEVKENTLMDTVGAVCIDDQGNVASGVSSGGILLKYPGRIGQAAVYGCGCWAEKLIDSSIGIATTGEGELLIKSMLCRRIAESALEQENLVQTIISSFEKNIFESKHLKQKKSKLAGVLLLKRGFDNLNAGLKDLCIESGVIAAGSVAGVIEGRKYNRAVRFHKLLYEALLRLAWKEFLAVLDQQSDYNKGQIEEMNEKIMELCEHLNQNTFTDILHDRLFETVAQQFGDFLNNLRQGNGTLAAFWMSYIDMVELMLKLLRASREGNWKLHLTSIHEMIPWCFSYDNINYARYLSAYYAEMTNLPEEHPEIHDYLEAGGFSVQIGSKNTFGKIPVDQTVEETVNRDMQTQGGTKGFSLKANALSRYYLTAKYRSSYLRRLKDMLNINQSDQKHNDLQAS